MAPPDYAASAKSEKVSVLALIKFSVFTETFAALCPARIIFDTQSIPIRPHILKDQKRKEGAVFLGSTTGTSLSSIVV